MRFFNTAGPCTIEEHYIIPPLERFDLDDILMLIKQQKYFVLHAPRQTGKTTSMLALMKYLNKEGRYHALYVNVESAQTARENVYKGIQTVMNEIGVRAELYLDNNSLKKTWPEILNSYGEHSALNNLLTYWSKNSSKSVVLVIDEIDALVGDTLISVLRQIRSGYDKKPINFPQSIILCGVRDVRDYRIYSDKDKSIITGGSAFNIKAKSLRLGDFTKMETKSLLMQHTKETNQKFEQSVFDYIFDQTSGQPWLVNAIAYELTYEIKENRDKTLLLTKDKTQEAVNRVILSRATHLDQLADKLGEKRVINIILPMILGQELKPNKDDKDYCIDLGLIKNTKRGLVISNKIYQEIIPRELTNSKQDTFQTRFSPDWITEKGDLNTDDLFEKFTNFWRKNSEIWASQIQGYEEAAPQLVFQAFLQRVANGGGYIDREYSSGRGRTDLMLQWINGRKEQRIVIELKIYSKNTSSIEKIEEKALRQAFDYADQQNSTENHIIIFDRDKIKKEWREKVYKKQVEYNGKKFKIWGV